MSAEKPCLICAKAPRSEGKLCDSCWKLLDANIAWLERTPQRLLNAARAFWTEATRAD